MRWLRQLVKETVIVHLVGDEPSFKGVLGAVHTDCLVLWEVQVLDSETRTTIDGELVVPRERVSYLQRLV